MPPTFNDEDNVNGAAKLIVAELLVCNRLPGMVHRDDEELPRVVAPCTVNVDNDVAPETVRLDAAFTAPLKVVCPFPVCVIELEYKIGPANDEVFVVSV